MTSTPQAWFQFGERHPDYDVLVFNERAVRAASGLLFAIGMVCFMNAWLVGNYAPTRVFVVLFLLDFSIRLFINPRFSPSLVIAQWMVRHQEPEWVGAPQKRFAWGIGWVLAASMLMLVVVNRVLGPINLLVCSICLTLMFFESAFGICLGCKLYQWFTKTPPQLCPGGVCAMPGAVHHPVQAPQWLGVALAAAVVAAIWQPLHDPAPAQPALSRAQPATSPEEAARCKVPEFAKAMGHEEVWKRHNNCS